MKMKREEKIECCKILGVKIAAVNMDKTLYYLEKNIEKWRGEYICVSNVHTTVMSDENEAYRTVQNRAVMALPDGKPLSVVCRLRGYKDADRVAGPDLMERVFEISEEKGYRHYFYGSTEETLSKLKRTLLKKYRNLNIVGMYSPPFKKMSISEDEEIVKEINVTKPDFVWIGLGAPKQENWMAEHRGIVNGLMIGVGAGFDYHAGNIKRAPKWMQKLSLEWLYRLMQEPKRLFRRYFDTNMRFIWKVFILRK